MPKGKFRNDIKDDYIKIRVMSDTKEDIQQLASLLGLSMTDLIVWSVLYPERIEVFKKTVNGTLD